MGDTSLKYTIGLGKRPKANPESRLQNGGLLLEARPIPIHPIQALDQWSLPQQLVLQVPLRRRLRPQDLAQKQAQGAESARKLKVHTQHWDLE